MIRTIDIKLNAAHPQLPILEATTFVGSPSAVMIHGVPPSVGAWRINAVRVVATYPDNTAHTVAAVLGAAGTWVATIPATDTSGRVAQGLQILADGVDERGEAVTGYVLGIADLAVYTRDMTIEGAAGVKYYVHLLDDEPDEPKEGDAYLDGSTLTIYHDGEWIEIAGGGYEPPPGGIPKTDLSAGVQASLNKADTAAQPAVVTLTPIYSGTPTFSAWAFSDVSDGITDIQQPVFHPSTGEPFWNVDFRYDGLPKQAGVFSGDENATNLTFVYADEGLNMHLTATRTRTDIIGYTLGSQTDKPLQPKGDYAPATGIQKSALAQNVQASLNKADTALQTAPVTSVNGKTGAVSLGASDVGALGNSGGQIISQGSLTIWNILEFIANYGGDGITFLSGGSTYTLKFPFASGTLALLADTMRFSTKVSYAVGDVVFYNGAFYRCTTAHTAGAWNASHFAEVIGGLSTGTPTAPTPTAQSADTQIATKKYVDDAVAGGGGGNLDYVMRVDPETGGIYYTTPDTNA